MIAVKAVRFLMVFAIVVLTGCDVLPDAIEGAYEDCPRGLVVQAEFCPGTGERLALCKAGGEKDGVSAPTSVVWCLVETQTTETQVDYAECVPSCP